MKKSINIKYIYERKGNYYFKKIINGTSYRCSLQTTDLFTAKTRTDDLINTYLKNGLEAFLLSPYFSRSKHNSIKKGSSRNTISKALDLYILSNQHLSKKNLKEKENLRDLIVGHKISWEVFNDPESFLEKFIEKVFEKSGSAHVQNKYCTHLKSFLKFSIKKGWYHRNEYDRLDFMAKPPLKNPRINFTKENIQDVVSYCMQKGYIDFIRYFLTLFYTCSRAGEPQFLQVKDLDFQNNTISIFQSKVHKSNQSSYKIVPVPKEHMDELAQYIRIQERQNPDDYIFDGADKHKDFYAKFWRENVRPHIDIDQRLALQRMRPTVITELANKKDILLANKMAGHKSLETTYGYYTNTSKTLALAPIILDNFTSKHSSKKEIA
ncbi:MAG: tyrosine-type recombinase/integrase [Brevinema sp.]